jgi:hypothetical protein
VSIIRLLIPLVLLTGCASKRVAELDERVQHLEDRNTELRDENDVLRGELEEAQGRVVALQKAGAGLGSGGHLAFHRRRPARHPAAV